ncbi:helix-turn-helix domain-containing protein [Mediterraneibacter agrestimuris]|uniref:helix-turn-helix domain-containing protein n=1 Tax=Mediterraneibacter agrestimuris TaxID=2941333 RepID=UPI0020406276|nr:helix-turn-helix domain-containing protein [Mediterraneibacter agrestimuris]
MNDKQALEQMIEMYWSLLIKNTLVNSVFDEHLYQELTPELLKCIRYFKKLE